MTSVAEGQNVHLGAAFGRSLAAEFRKVTSVKLWWVLAIVIVGYAGLIAVVMAFVAAEIRGAGLGGGVKPAWIAYSALTSVGYVVPFLFGTLASTSEFRSRSLTPTFLATPVRWISLVTKSIANGAFGIVLGLFGLVAVVGASVIVFVARSVATELSDPLTYALFARAILAFALWAIIGVGFGALVRNQVAAIVIVLGFTQFVEPILRSLGALWKPVAHIVNYLPGAASDSLVGASFFKLSMANSGVTELSQWQGGLVLGGYAVLFVVIALATSWRRDVS